MPNPRTAPSSQVAAPEATAAQSSGQHNHVALDTTSENYPQLLEARWNECLPEVDATSVPLFSMATALGRQVELFYEAALKPFGIQLSEYRVLVGLLTSQDNGMTPASLNALLKQSSAGITKTINRLEARGLIVKTENPLDSRSVIVSLSKQGQETIQSLCAHVAQEQNKRLAWLGEQERAQALSGLRLLLQSF